MKKAKQKTSKVLTLENSENEAWFGVAHILNNKARLEKYSFDFVKESNRIEGIIRTPTPDELTEFDWFMGLKTIKIEHLEHFVRAYQPGAVLRDKPGLDVRVGLHTPLPGGPAVVTTLGRILANLVRGPQTVTQDTPDSAYWTHIAYEHLHPFTDGNGRSGRMLWAWQMGYEGLALGFLHKFYYQTLASS